MPERRTQRRTNPPPRTWREDVPVDVGDNGLVVDVTFVRDRRWAIIRGLHARVQPSVSLYGGTQRHCHKDQAHAREERHFAAVCARVVFLLLFTYNARKNLSSVGEFCDPVTNAPSLSPPPPIF